jgi:hypothetical protein
MNGVDGGEVKGDVRACDGPGDGLVIDFNTWGGRRKRMVSA